MRCRATEGTTTENRLSVNNEQAEHKFIFFTATTLAVETGEFPGV